MNELQSLVNVNILIQRVLPTAVPPDLMLIVGLPPIDGSPDPVKQYRNLAAVEADGYVTFGTNADPVGIAARIAFRQSPAPDRLFIATQQEGSSTALEPITDTLNRADEQVPYYAICPAGIGTEQFEAIANWAENHEKMFGYTYMAKTDPVPATFFRSHGWCGLVKDDETPAEQEMPYVHVAAIAKCLTFMPGSITWANMSVHGFPRISLSQDLRETLTEADSNYLINIGRNVTGNGITRGGEWIDVIHGRDWLTSYIQRRIVSLFEREPKVPFTNAGITQVSNELAAALAEAQERGIIEDDEYDENDALVPGFVITVPDATAIPPEQKQTRKLQGVRFTAKLAGAIHVVNIDGVLTF